MGVRITDTQNVALYDSVTGIAFGETFNSVGEAEEFLRGLAVGDGDDPRNLSPVRLAEIRLEWERARA